MLQKLISSDPTFSQSENLKESANGLQELLDEQKKMQDLDKSGVDKSSELEAIRNKIYAAKKSEADKTRNLSVELEKIKARHRNRILITSDVMYVLRGLFNPL